MYFLCCSVDDRLCFRKEIILFENSDPVVSEVTDNNLFCIYYDNSECELMWGQSLKLAFGFTSINGPGSGVLINWLFFLSFFLSFFFFVSNGTLLVQILMIQNQACH